MITKKRLKSGLFRTVFGWFFAIIALGMTIGPMLSGASVFALEAERSNESESSALVAVETNGTQTEAQEADGGEVTGTTAEDTDNKVKVDGCKNSLGAVGWLVCPVTGKIAEGVDALYGKLEDFLIVEPISMEDGSPVYEIWKYCLMVTNIVFIIFLLVVIYSQITGMGISNYGVKKALPKLIVTAVIVNMSFLICSLAVDLSNTVGNALTGLFSGIEQAAAENSTANISMGKAYGSVVGGTALAVGAGAVLFDPATIWMLIPVALGALVAVAIGLFMLALRQAVVVLLTMIAPLAFVAYILPNTEHLFRKWKQLFIKMMTFYPLFSLLFGASSLAGFAIIMSATSGFGILLGLAVQIFPLFLAVNLMKMSGTFLGGIYSRLNGIASRPLATSRAWADSRRQLTHQRNLAAERSLWPSVALMSFLARRRIAREEETKEHMATVRNHGLAYGVSRKYTKRGVPKKAAERDYAAQAKNMEYEQIIERHRNNMNMGLGQLSAVKANATTAKKARLERLDIANVKAADRLFAEKSRGEKIEYDNVKGRHERYEDAINAHFDEENRYVRDENGRIVLDENGNRKVNTAYVVHRVGKRKDALDRYDMLLDVMDGDTSALDAQFAAANAAHAYDTQTKIIATKFQKYFELVPPTRDVRYRLEEFSKFSRMADNGRGFDIKSSDNIDAVISGMRVLNQRGDTNFVKNIMDDILDEKYGGIELGTHASQALASFLMFEVKDNDPYLRRFGKYINLETARVFDKGERKKTTVDYDEYVLGYHTEPDGTTMYAKKDMAKLMEGTPLDGVERTAFDNFDESLRKVYTKDGKLDLEAYEKKKKQVDKATGPQFISASTKFLSGSEQIVSAVKAKTGYAWKQNKDTGEYYVQPIWEDEKEAAELFSAYNTPEEKAEAKNGLKGWYREQTLQYLRDQTPAQILGLRSDYRDPLLEHLSAAYLLDENGEEIPEKVARHREALALIDNNDFGEVEPAKIADKRKKARDALRMQEAGETFRELLYKKGKLAQIEKSKRSGAANNAKDWVRELLLLDSDNGLREWIYRREGADVRNRNSVTDSENDQRKSQKKTMNNNGPQDRKNDLEGRTRRYQQRDQILKMIDDLKKEQSREADPELESDGRDFSVYTPEDVAMFTDYVENKWQEMRNDDDDEGLDEFYNDTYDYLVENIGAENVVTRMYEKYREDNPEADMHELYEFLVDLLKTLL